MRTLRAAVAALLLLGLAACGRADAGAGDGAGGVEGGAITLFGEAEREPLPAFSGTTLDGGTLSSEDLRGSVAVLNVWGSWCGPCRTEAPELEQVARDYAEEGVRVVGIDVKDTPGSARAFVERHGLTYPSLDDSDARVQLALREVLPPSVPSTVVVDREGRVAATAYGAVTARDVVRMLDPLLGAPPEEQG